MRRAVDLKPFRPPRTPRRMHMVNSTYVSVSYCGYMSGLGDPAVTSELGAVTCRVCRHRAEEVYASQRDGFDYRQARYQAKRDLATDRANARRLVAERHQEEYETELAMLRLARGANA